MSKLIEVARSRQRVTFNRIRSIVPNGAWFDVTLGDDDGRTLTVVLTAAELANFHRTRRAIFRRTGRVFYSSQFDGHRGSRHWRDIISLLLEAGGHDAVPLPAGPSPLPSTSIVATGAPA